MDSSLATSGDVRKKNLFFLAALFCVAIPGFAAIKATGIILLWVYVASTSPLKTWSLLWFASVILNLSLWSEVALFHHTPTADITNQFSRILVFYLVLGLAAFIARKGVFDLLSADHLILTISVTVAIIKIAILAAVLSGLFSLEAIQSGLGFETVTDDIGFGLQRLQFPSDISLIFLIVSYSGGKRKIIDLLLLISMTIGIFLSFSRFLFAAYIVCLIIRYLRIRKFDQVSAAALSVVLFFGAIFSVSLVTRFNGEGTQASDNTRVEQIEYLTQVILEHPLLGIGVGSSVSSYKRSATIPFSYEVQWYAMTMQLGFLGLAWFLVNLLAPLSRCLYPPVRFGIFLSVLALWFAAGFTNPLITSLGSAFGLGLLMLVLIRDAQKHSAPSTDQSLSLEC
jgi:hypothetical protein